MKIYTLKIDASKPIRQVLTVPARSSRYGIAVKATADGMRIANPHCQMIIDGSAVQPTKTLDDGSFLFEMTSDMVSGEHEVMFHVVNMDELSSESSATSQTFYFGVEDSAKTNLSHVIKMRNILWYYRVGDGGIFSDDEPITFTGDVIIGHKEKKKVGNRIKDVWEGDATIPAGKYYTKELDRIFFGGAIGRVADCKVPVVLKEVKNPISSEEIEEKNLDCDTLTVGGVEYVRTTLTVDGVEYQVLAVSQPEPEAEPTEPEPTTDGE